MLLNIETLPGDKFRLIEPVEVRGTVIPRGFETDFASIPRWAWSVIGHPVHSKFQRASLYHDYMLTELKTEGVKASKIFLSVLIEDGVNIPKAFVMYLAVRFADRRRRTNGS